MRHGTCILEGDGEDEGVEESLVEEGAERPGEVVEDGLVLALKDHEGEVVGQAED